jgi:hypothetical protein
MSELKPWRLWTDPESQEDYCQSSQTLSIAKLTMEKFERPWSHIYMILGGQKAIIL